PSREVWVDDPGGRSGGGRRPVRRRALRGPVPAGGGDGDDGPGVDDQRGAPGRRGVLVVPGPGPLRAGAAAGGAGGHDRGDGHGLCRGDAVAPQAADRHDRHGRGSLRMTADQTLLLTLVVLPAAVGAVLALTRAERVAAPIAVSTAAVTALLAAVVAVARPAVAFPFIAGVDVALEVDALAALTLPMVAVVTLLVLVFAAGNIRAARPRFHGLMLLFAAAALITASAASLPALLFAWELMGATSYALIGFWWRDTDRVSAGLTAFLTTRTADLGLYLAAGAALAGGAGMGLAELPAAESPRRDVVAAAILVVGRGSAVPFSCWVSGGMTGASPVSARLHSAAMVAMGGYLLLRVEPLLASTGWAGPAAAWIGLLTAVAMGIVALAQRDLKQLLAASTVAQMGFVVLAAGVGAVSGGAAQLVAHASTKALLFLAAGAWLTALGTEKLTELRGAGRRWPVVGVTATVGALALAGIAPLSL